MIQGWLIEMLSGNTVLVGLELLILGLFFAAIAHLLATRARGYVYVWAARGGWEITRCRRCLLVAGGQFVLPGMPVYRVTLRSRSGREREAYIRVGNYILGALSDELAIQWVETAGR